VAKGEGRGHRSSKFGFKGRASRNLSFEGSFGS